MWHRLCTIQGDKQFNILETTEFSPKTHIIIKFKGTDTEALKQSNKYALKVSEVTKDFTSFNITKLDPEAWVVVHPVEQYKDEKLFLAFNSHENMRKWFTCQVRDLEQVSVFDDRPVTTLL